jgi:hypothetical protein
MMSPDCVKILINERDRPFPRHANYVEMRVSRNGTLRLLLPNGNVVTLSPDGQNISGSAPIPDTNPYIDLDLTAHTLAAPPAALYAIVLKSAPADPDIAVTGLSSLTTTSARVHLSATPPTATYTLKYLIIPS